MNIEVVDTLNTIFEIYGIESNINICLSFKLFSLSGKSSKWHRFTESGLFEGCTIGDKEGKLRPLEFNGLILHRQVLPGTIVERDSTSNSEYA